MRWDTVLKILNQQSQAYLILQQTNIDWNVYLYLSIFNLIPTEGEKLWILNRFRKYREVKEETIRGKIGFVIWGKRIKPIADFFFLLISIIGTEVKWNSSDFACKVLLVYTSHPILDQNIYPVLMQNLCDCV